MADATKEELRAELGAASVELKQLAADYANLRAKADGLLAALQESIERSDEELANIKLAQALIGAHNANVAKHAAATELLKRAKAQLQAFAHTTISRAALMAELDAFLAAQSAPPWTPGCGKCPDIATCCVSGCKGCADGPAASARSEQDAFPGMPPAGWR